MNELLSVVNLARGAVVEQFDTEMKRVLENIQDPNTSPVKKRKMTITLTFEPSENRDESEMQIVTKLTLVPTNAISTRIFIDKDTKGNLVAGELTRGAMPGQTMVDAETGEIVETNKIYKVK